MAKKSKTITEFPFPNLIIIEWLEEKYENAKKNNLNSRFTYKKAVESLKKYPLSIKDIAELNMIQNFGKGIISKLEDIWEDLLKKHSEANGNTNPLTQNIISQETTKYQKNKLRRSTSMEEIQVSREKEFFLSQEIPKTKNYIPAYRCGPYAMLVTLLKQFKKSPNDAISKSEIIRLAQPYCDSSFTIPDPPGSFKTAWMGMNTLLKKELVLKTENRPAKYILTNYGVELAQKIKSAHKQITNGDSANNDSVSHLLEQSTVVLDYDHEIILLIDNMEYYGPMASKFQLIRCIETAGIKCDVRKLTIGDFLWIARDRNHPNDQTREIVLDFIVERKRMDDLSHSIIDGRYAEQKFRLKRCGIKNKIYLVEGKNLKGNEVKEQTLLQSMINTMVAENFIVHRTRDIQETVLFLQNVTNQLIRTYENIQISAKSIEKLENQTIVNHATFNSFNEFSKKSQDPTVKQVFTYMLMHIEGMSYKKTVAITDTYPTLSNLISAYDALDGDDKRRSMLSDMIMPGSKRKLGPVISEHVYNIFYA